MNFETIAFEIRGQTAYIALNRPASFNALNLTSGKELMSAAISCDENWEIRAVVLTGTGKAFCAGGDLPYFAEQGAQLPVILKEMATYCHAATSRFMRMDKPLITAVNGAAAGIGMSLALAGDIILAGESASFMAAYTAAGLSPDGAMTYLLPRMIGLSRARELILTNRRLKAGEALDWGLINKVVSDEVLLSEAELLATSLENGPTRSYGMVKKLLNDCFSATPETQMEQEARGITEMARTRDGLEGINAFVGKQPPKFKGC
ncbi:MAG: enoyl-CoA hydratase/isomerase family protein [Desulfuromonadales bacterium]|nr:enoyl-CoA hydratase/isomerase family protein [Desulfuromonadales bacterium]